MRKVVPIKLKFFYLDKPESSSRLKAAYGRIFMIAKQNILNKEILGKNGGEDKKT